jgi:hypothetical protein
MTDSETPVFDPNKAIHLRLLGRARAMNGAILSRFSIAAGDLEGEFHLRALGALDGVETEIANLKTLLRLIDG